MSTDENSPAAPSPSSSPKAAQSSAAPLSLQTRIIPDEANPLHDALRECVAMTDYLFSSTKTVPPSAASSLHDRITEANLGAGLDPEQLAELHNELAGLIEPAKPCAVAFVYEQSKKGGGGGWRRFQRFFGPIPIIRRMLILSVFSLACFIYLSASGRINEEMLDTSLFYREGNDQVLIALFFISGAAIGASFANLYRAYQYVSKGAYDPKLDATYWMRFVLGITAGYILAEVVTLNFDTQLERFLI